MKDIIHEKIIDINSLEKASLEMARLNMELSILELEEELFKNKPDYLESISFKWRTISTKVGDIRFKRRLYYNNKTKEYIFLLDEELNLRKRKRVSGEYLKLLVILSTMLTYRQVEYVIKQAGFPPISHGTIFNEVRSFGERESKRIKNEKEELFTNGKIATDKQKEVPLLFVEVDGIMLSSQEKDSKRFEAKIGLFHEGWEYTSPSKKRKRLKEAKIVSGIYDSVEDFYEELILQINKKYNLDKTKVILNGDGASWIQDTAYDYFDDLKVQLDRFHIKKDISGYFGYEVAQDLCRLLGRGEKQVFLDTLESLIYEGETEKNIKKRKQIFNHFKKYESHLLDYRHRIEIEEFEQELHGLGAIESYVDKNAARRMKNRGMSWVREGAEAMIRILMLVHNGILKERLEDEYYQIKNPVKKLKYRKRKFEREWSNWIQAKMPVLTGPSSGKNWVKGLKSLVTV